MVLSDRIPDSNMGILLVFVFLGLACLGTTMSLVSSNRFLSRFPGWLGKLGWVGLTALFLLRWKTLGWELPPVLSYYELCLLFVWSLLGIQYSVEIRYSDTTSAPLAYAISTLALFHGIFGLNPTLVMPEPVFHSLSLQLYYLGIAIGSALLILAAIYSLFRFFSTELRSDTLWMGLGAFQFGVLPLWAGQGYWLEMMTRPRTEGLLNVAGAAPLFWSTMLLLSAYLLGVIVVEPIWGGAKVAPGWVGDRHERISRIQRVLRGLFLGAQSLLWILVFVLCIAHFGKSGFRLGEHTLEVASLIFVSYLGALFVLIVLRRGDYELLSAHENELESYVFHLVIQSLPFLMFGIFFGALWSYQGWGEYWGWRSREIVLLGVGLFASLYLLLRTIYFEQKMRFSALPLTISVIVCSFLLNLTQNIDVHSRMTRQVGSVKLTSWRSPDLPAFDPIEAREQRRKAMLEMQMYVDPGTDQMTEEKKVSQLTHERKIEPEMGSSPDQMKAKKPRKSKSAHSDSKKSHGTQSDHDKGHH